MRESRLFQHQLPNGIVVLGEVMPWLQTAAFSLQLPAGSAYQELGQNGVAALTCEMTERGCGEYGNRAFLEAVELLGANTNNHVSTYHTGYAGSCLSANFFEVLRLYACLTREPALRVEEFSASHAVCMQELYAQQDDLAQQTLRCLRQRFFGEALGRWPDGDEAELQQLRYEDVRGFYNDRFSPQGMILSVAGNFDWESCLQQITALWGDWQAASLPLLPTAAGVGGYEHLVEDSQQTHLAIAVPTVPFGRDEYFLMRLAVGVLGDGMSSRLFQEVREKRGLCYTVFAGVHSMRDSACLSAYAGTTSPRAQETLDTILEELARLQQGISVEELKRIKTQVRTGLMAQQESCRSRAGTMASDWFYLNRVRTQDEINAQLERLTVTQVNQFLAEHPLQVASIVTVGPHPLELPDGVCQLSTS